MNVQRSRAWKLNEKESTHCPQRKYWKKVRCNLLITNGSFHIQMVLSLCLEDGCGRLILLASWAVAALWRACSHLLYQIMLSDRSLFSATHKMTTPTIRIKVCSAAHWSPIKQDSPMIWSSTKWPDCLQGRTTKKKKKTHIPMSHHASLSAAGRAAISVIHI